ncbi:hypothetical protein CRUP_015006 [Coryphaenoides rupestris]|nr:hypothetical protein CRUP_015006 [Coryphaenoides rupestris]
MWSEYRGISLSMGGDKALETVTTVPNILRKFNPELRGMSKGQGTRQTGFNMAITGAMASSFPDQARRLIAKMKNTTAVDFTNDWKLVTLFIGANDLCQYCNNRRETENLVYSGHYDAREDFAVVLQPFLRNIVLPLTPEHPYIFTRVNSYQPASTTSPASTSPATSTTSPAAPLGNTDDVPAWGAAILAVGSFLIGCVLTWLLLSCLHRRSLRKMESTFELKGTDF